MRVALLWSFLSAFLLMGCAGGGHARQVAKQTGENVPPGHCRVLAEVVKIDSTLHGQSANAPCSKAPCVAWIVVRRVIAHGSGTDRIGSGDTLRTRFAFTLNPTSKQEFPTLNEQLPGLTVGSRFTADIQAVPQGPYAGDKGGVYMIYGYRKLEQ